MKRNLGFKTLALFALAFSMAAFAAAELPTVADVKVDASGLQFQPQVAHGKLVLTVSGPRDFHHRAIFAAGEMPAFAPPAGLADGVYSYELLVVPALDEQTRERLAAAREAGDDGLVRELQDAGKLPEFALTQSGAFTILGGAMVADDRPERIVTKDQVFLDDVIISFSLCVGNDCVNGESFGFDTIRLKENNLRIHFQDTSNTASFPTNDWRIVINDSSNGGDNYFRIEDSNSGRNPFQVNAGAPSNAMLLDSAGDLGLGTSNPVVDLHVVSGNTPTLRLEQNGSSGFAAQTFDIAGNEANFFIRDVTNGSELPFKIKPGADTGAFFIAANSNVGIGTESPDALLHVRDASNPVNLRVSGNASGIFMEDLGGNANEKFAQILLDGSALRLRGLTDAFGISAAGISIDMATSGVGVNCVGAAAADLVIGSGEVFCSSGTRSEINAGDTTFTVPSSRTFKENLSPVAADGILDKIDSIGVYEYDYIDGPKDRLGLMAEDFHQVFERGSDKMLNGSEIDMALWLAVQELTARNQALATQNGELAERLAALEAALAQD